MNYLREIVKAYQNSPVEGITAEVMTSNDGIIFRKGLIMAKVYDVTNVITVFRGYDGTSHDSYTGPDAMRYLATEHPDLESIVSKAWTDMAISRAISGSKGSFLFPDMFTQNNEKIQICMDRWRRHTGREAYLNDEQTMDFYRHFLMSGKKNIEEDIMISDMTRWLFENHIQSVKNGTAVIAVKDGMIAATVNTDGAEQKTEYPLSMVSDMTGRIEIAEYMKKVLQFIYDEFNILTGFEKE